MPNINIKLALAAQKAVELEVVDAMTRLEPDSILHKQRTLRTERWKEESPERVKMDSMQDRLRSIRQKSLSLSRRDKSPL